MKKSIDLLQNKLEAKHISEHVICPSAKMIVPELKSFLKNSIEVIDERSAGYVATGMCEEIEGPVVLWCADNSSYRNLTSALTEAFYRKLPILVVALFCEDNINQSINPQDTIRYYANNSSENTKGTETSIDVAIKYLLSEIKGPVYLSLSSFSKAIPISSTTHNNTQKFDISAIASIFPSDACIHFSPNVVCKFDYLKDVVSRTDHNSRDGNLSMLIGSSIVAPKQLHIGVFTNEEISYDLNMFGNRHIGNNVIVIGLKTDNNSCAIHNFAHKMEWNCIKVSIADIDSINDSFTISNKPQYIEVSL